MTNYNFNSDKNHLGDIGEWIISIFTNSVLSESKVDNKKDMTDRGTKETREVKCQPEHPTKHVMSVNKNQLPKCTSVDHLNFVKYDKSDIITALEVLDKNDYEEYTTSQGWNMVGWKISDMKVLVQLDNPELARLMRSLSSSSQFPNKLPPIRTFDELGKAGILELISKSKIVNNNPQLLLDL